MLIWLLMGLLLGVVAGTVTGLFPGIHINLVAAGLLAYLGYFSGIDVMVLVVFIVAMAVTHTFLDFIPSIFLGAPEEDSFLSVLPGHKMLKEGRGFDAVVYTLYGSLFALPVVLIFSLLFVNFLEGIFSVGRIVIPYVLVFVSLYMILREEEFLLSGSVFLFAGFLGLFVFNLPVKQPLLPLLSGLFGISSLIVSLGSKTKIGKQRVKKLKKIKLEGGWKHGLAAALVAPFASFLPGIGSGHAAVVCSEFVGEDGDVRGFLFLVGAINTIVMALSFVTVYVIGRTRSGAAVAVGEILGEISLGNLIVIMGAVLVSGVVAFFLGIFLAGIFARNINRISYGKISIGIIGMLVIVNLVLSNWLGFVVLVTGSALGVFCILSKVRRVQLMGALLVPVIVFYLFG